ncbi:MAG TPA: long-chain-fatty-acid--CoA ligase [Steroidobacteraceae bacterium]|nr:long-chain-fatty-acid--CoA ligase [Steroidobacteraceae bacterium]
MKQLTLDRMLRRQAADRGAKIALRAGAESSSYAVLDRRASQVARGLIAAGVRPGDRVAYLGRNTLDYFEYFLGAVKARAVMVPVNWRLAEPEVRFILENARPRSLLAEAPFAALAGRVATGIPLLVSAGEGSSYRDWRERQPADDTPATPDWSEPLLQLYTSGTTGWPKGAVLTHRSLFGLRTDPDSLPAWYRWSPEDVSLIAMPVAHVSGTGWGIWTLQHGATGVIASEFVPQAVFDQIVEHRINKLMMVPTALQIAVRHPRSRSTDFSFLRYIYYGGAPIPEALLRECTEVFGCGFVQMYGMTETSGTIVALAPEDHAAGAGRRARSVGRPLPGVELRILDRDGREVPAGTIGEIATRSVANMMGYFDNPVASAETLDAAGWLRTGDAGQLDADGYLYLEDRIKDLIISGGENIYPAEVENAIFGHPAVAEVAVIGVPDEKWGEAVRAVLVAAPGATRDEAGILAWAAERIARYKLPKSFVWIDALPRSHTGKVLRRKLRATQGGGTTGGG